MKKRLFCSCRIRIHKCEREGESASSKFRVLKTLPGFKPLE